MALIALCGAVSAPAAAQVSVGTGFSYQGFLRLEGDLVNGATDLRFRLFDSDVGGSQVSASVDIHDHPVANGVFTAYLDFGASPWNGHARWLDIQVRPGDAVGAYHQLTPRQLITAAPLALYALNAASLWEQVGSGIANANNGFVGINRSNPIDATEYFGVQIPATGSNFGGMYVRATSSDARPYYGYSTNTRTALTYLNGANGDWRVRVGTSDRLTISDAGNVGIGTTNPQSILHVQGNGGALGLWGSGAAPGVVPMLHFRNGLTFNDWVLRHEESSFHIATETSGNEKLTITDFGRVGIGTNAPNAKLHVINATAETVIHAATTGLGPAGVFNIASTSNANAALSATTIGPGPAIIGDTGADGSNDYIPGVAGITTGNNGIGVFGYTTGVGGAAVGVLGRTDGQGWAGFFEGNVGVAGTMAANTKQFVIDHPAKPAEAYLVHGCVESDDYRNLYDGVVTLDGEGRAVVDLPPWFEVLNADFRYQLTAVGAAMPGLHVANEIKQARFTIAGGAPGARVSWQVTGRRIDPAATAARFDVVRPKTPAERGRYLNPELYDRPESERLLRSGPPRREPTAGR
ncbi:MAG: hypothetical protein HRU75_00060 [Planctomycetia bacterium]|nr:MAG: hypothetical protein HRU75_00060 [Planctomycetia bacterium]